MVYVISYKVESVSELEIEERLGVEALAAIIMNFDSDVIKEYDYLVAALERNKYKSNMNNLELDMKHRESQPTRPCIVEVPKLELKALPPYLRYAFLDRDDTLPIIIESELNGQQVECLVVVLKRFKRAIG